MLCMIWRVQIEVFPIEAEVPGGSVEACKVLTQFAECMSVPVCRSDLNGGCWE
jgi:hypothetical protein